MAVDAPGAVGVTAILEDYDRLLLAADHAPWLVWLRMRPERPGGGSDVWRLPRPTVMLRFFVRTHVRRGVETLHRRLSAEQALARPTAVPEEEEAVALYLQAVPPTHGRAIGLALVAGFLVLGRLAVQYAGQALSRVPALTHVHEGGLFSSAASADRSQQAQRLMHEVGDALGQGVPSPAKVLDVLLSARPADLAVVASASSLALYAVLRPFVPAFRVKRALLNVGGDPLALRSTTARWHVARRTGVYAREQRVFGRLGTHPPLELPFDLLVSGLLCVVPLGLGTYLLIRASWWAKWVGFVLYDLTLVIGCLLVFLAFVRAAWLVQTGRRRQRADDEVRPPYDVRLSDGRHVVVRDPLAVGLLVFLLPQAFLLWLWAVVRDWRRVIRAAEGGKADRGAAVIGLRVSRSSLRWFGGLVGACVLGWVLLQIPIVPVTFLIPLEPLHEWPGVWWPPLIYWLVLSVGSAPVAAYCQVSVNRLFDRSGSRVWEGPAPSTASLDEPCLGSTADALRDQLNWG